MALPKMCGADLSWSERGNHVGHLLATAALEDDTGATIPGLTLQLEVKKPIVVDRCLYELGVFILDAGVRRIVLYKVERLRVTEPAGQRLAQSRQVPIRDEDEGGCARAAVQILHDRDAAIDRRDDGVRVDAAQLATRHLRDARSDVCIGGKIHALAENDPAVRSHPRRRDQHLEQIHRRRVRNDHFVQAGSDHRSNHVVRP